MYERKIATELSYLLFGVEKTEIKYKLTNKKSSTHILYACKILSSVSGIINLFKNFNTENTKYGNV